MPLATSQVNLRDAYAVWRRDVEVHLRLWKMNLIAPAIGELTGSGSISPEHALDFRMHTTLHTSGAFMLGRWLGCSYDDEFASGTSVIARDAEVARLQMCKRLPTAVDLLGPLEASNGA